MIFAFLFCLAGSLAASSAGAASSPEVVATIQPPAGKLCAVASGSAETVRCGPCAAGDCRLDVPESWRDADLSVEASAEQHFSETRIGRIGERMVFRLTPHPSIDWEGWTRESSATAADIDWLPAGRSEEWRTLGKAFAPGKIFLPGEARAIRLSAAGRGSPKTFFAGGPRAAFGAVGPLPAKPGAEIALCLEVSGRLTAPPPTTLHVADFAGGEHVTRTDPAGCVAIDGLPSGLATIAADASTRYRFQPIPLRLRAGESSWLGTVRVSAPGTLTVRVEDGDSARAYSVAVESSNPLGTGRIREGARITAGSPRSWELPAAEYRVSLDPEAGDTPRLTEIIDLKSSEERTVSFSVGSFRVSGIAYRGGAPLSRVPLHFSREDDSVRESSLRLTTEEDGSFAGWFGRAGRWRVTVGEESGAGGATRSVELVVPDAAASTVDLRFPAGAVSGVVVEAKTGKSMGPVPLRAEGRETESDRPFSMTMTSDASGRFRLDSLPDCRVSIGVPDAIASAMRVRSGARAIADVHGDEEQSLELRLEPIEEGARLRIVDRNGTPIVDAQAYRADTGPIGALLGRSDDRGEISLPKDIPAGAPIYVIASAHPWAKTSAPSENESPRPVSLEDPRREPAILRFEPSQGSPPTEIFFGLTDSAGNEVPVFFHMIRQGALPTARAGTAAIPQAGDGAYVVWVRGAHGLHALGTVVFPSTAPLVLALGPCGSDCAGP